MIDGGDPPRAEGGSFDGPPAILRVTKPVASRPARGQRCLVDRTRVMQWVADYERAWREGDVAGVARLFTESASYRTSPYAEPKVGHAEIQAFWLDDEGRTFTMTAEPVAVEGANAVVRLEVGYRDPVAQQYRDLWVLRFAPDGRVEHFEEWAYWPGKPFTSEAEAGER